MQQTTKPVSKLKVALLWLVLIGNIIFWVGLVAWWHRNDPPAPDQGPGTELVFSVVMLVLGAGFLIAGVTSYFLVLLTTCFTFNFDVPVFAAYKGKLYLAKIFVPMLASVGIGLILAVVFAPLLTSFGVQGQMKILLPLLIALIPLQISQMWFNLWASAIKKLIAKRLATRGISFAQLQTATLAGISDPTRSSFKKLTLIEDDIGALWLTAHQLVYWGDLQAFAINREQIVQLERRADSGSTSMLAGTAHVILHVQQPDNSIRQLRLHTEGYWTLGQNRRAMDTLAAAITNWHATPTASPISA